MAAKPIYEDTEVKHSPPPKEETFNEDETLSIWTRMGINVDSFRRRTAADKNNQLNQTLKTRHMNMIAIGGSIGAGLFVGSGGALSTGGPASLIIDFLIIGIMIFNVVYALGELAIMYPVSGGFYIYSTRFIDPSWGFAMGWNYFAQWATILPFEIIVAAECVRFWRDDISPAVWYSMFLAAIILINIFGILGYGEEEFWSSVLKLSAVVTFLITAFIFVLGGGPDSGSFSSYQGAKLWYEPGAFANGFRGFCGVFVTAAFSFSGAELVGLAAAESKTPLKSLPSAVKQVFWRITLFYILSLLFIGLLIPYNDEELFGAGNFIDTTASPFVLVAKRGGLPTYASFINVVICVSVVSIGLSGVFGGSRTLCALAEQGYAPKLFAYVDRAGRPLPATLLIIAMGGLAYVGLAPEGVVIFDWLLALSGLAALFTWGSICLAHIRFRAAWAHHGHTVDEIPFKAIGGVVGSWVGLSINVLVLIAQFYTALTKKDGSLNDAEGFFKSFLAFFVVLFFWIVGYIWKREGWRTLDQIDVDTGRREIDWESHNAEMEKRKTAPGWKRVYYFMC